MPHKKEYKLFEKNLRIYDLSMEFCVRKRYNKSKGGSALDINKKTIRTVFLGVAGCIVLYWMLHETQRIAALFGGIVRILSPFIIGAAVAFVLNVPMRGIESGLKKIKKAGLRRALSLLLTLLAVALVLYGVFYLLIPQIGDTIESIAVNLPGFFRRMQQSITSYLQDNPSLLEWASKYADFQNWDWNTLIQKAVSIFTGSLSNVFNKAFTAIVSLGAGIFNGILSFVFALYCLARKEVLARQGRRILYSFLPEHICDETIRILRMTCSTFSRFISGQCLEALILGVMFAITMPIFKMPYVPLISVIIAITALVPIVGAFAGCIIGGFFILVVNPLQAFWFVVLFLVLQQIEGNLIYPKVVGSSVGLPGMWVLVAVAVGGDLMGVAGMLLMIPFASVCYALAREITDRRLEKRQIAKEKLQDQPLDVSQERVQRRKKKPSKHTSENE